MHDDLIRAREILAGGDYTCVLCRDTQVKTCTARGIRPLLELLESGDWRGFCAADKVVGKATALLYVLLGVKAVWAPVMSEGALQVLDAHGIEANCDLVTPAIVNRDRSGLCPMETAVRDIHDPAAALPAIRHALERLRRMNRKITLEPRSGDSATAIFLIRQFWKAHNGEEPSAEEAASDLARWTASDHRFFLICRDTSPVGFLHLGSRGCKIDWLEDIFVLPAYQRQGIGSEAIALAERLVFEYSESLYIEAAARNRDAIRLYRKLGYDCLNTVTLRKDLHPERYTTLRTESIHDGDFHIKIRKQS